MLAVFVLDGQCDADFKSRISDQFGEANQLTEEIEHSAVFGAPPLAQDFAVLIDPHDCLVNRDRVNDSDVVPELQ